MREAENLNSVTVLSQRTSLTTAQALRSSVFKPFNHQHVQGGWTYIQYQSISRIVTCEFWGDVRSKSSCLFGLVHS